ncbi:MAG: hypothetical protein MJ206_02785 [Bacilli bacterium]|nr:hypothetical protein [Bacilli bacterium]
MATSSIFASFDIKESKKAESFAFALKSSIDATKNDKQLANCDSVKNKQDLSKIIKKL